MKAAIVEKIGSFRIAEIPVPRPGAGEILVRTAIAGFCRTDLKIIEKGHRDLVLPRIPGEEVVGTVCEVGASADPSLLGRMVYLYPGTSCGVCKACSRGAENLCREMRIMGFHRDGGFAEYLVAPAKSAILVPDACPPEDAVLTEPLSCCLNALELASLKSGEKIGIWGGGPAGALLSRAALALGASPTVVEPLEHRHRYHANAVKSAEGMRFDVAVVAVGSVQAYREALSSLEPRGRLVVFSGLSPEESFQSLDFNMMHYLEQGLVGAYGCSYRHSVEALDLIHSGKVRVADLISHRIPLEYLGKALDIVREKSGMKILLYPGSDMPEGN